MKPDWGSVAAAAVLAFMAGLLVTDTLGGRGRYQIVETGNVVARLNTATGEVVGCRSSTQAWPQFDCTSPLGSR